MDRAETGRTGEAVAARYYQKQGCELVAHNYRTRMGEIDLILREPDGTLTLHLNKAPAYPMFNKPDIAEKFRLAMQTLTGQNVHVVMQPMDTATQIKQRQIEELAHFPNVTIR